MAAPTTVPMPGLTKIPDTEFSLVGNIERRSATEILVKVRSDKRDNLVGREVRAFAEKKARDAGFNPLGLGGTPMIYPVDDANEVSAAVVTGTVPVAGYCADIRLSTGIPTG